MANRSVLLRNLLTDSFDSGKLIRMIFERTKLVHFAKHELLIQQGHDVEWVGVVNRGMARWFCEEGTDDTKSIIHFFGEGDFITAPFSFFNRTPAYGSIQAMEKMEVHVLSREDYDAIAREYPEFVVHAYRLLSETMMQFWTDKNQLLNLTAVERYHFFQERYTKIAHRIPLGNVSAYLGIRQSSLSRVRREMSRNGL